MTPRSRTGGSSLLPWLFAMLMSLRLASAAARDSANALASAGGSQRRPPCSNQKTCSGLGSGPSLARSACMSTDGFPLLQYAIAERCVVHQSRARMGDRSLASTVTAAEAAVATAGASCAGADVEPPAEVVGAGAAAEATAAGGAGAAVAAGVSCRALP